MAMVFEAAAHPLQLVLDGKESDPHVDLVDGVRGKASRSFETSKQWVPRLGSSAIIGLAASMLKQGTKVMRFDVRDVRLDPIERADADRISSSLIDAIEAGGAPEANRLLANEYRDYLIDSLEVLVDSRRATVQRQGVVFTSNRETFLQLLRSVWREAVNG